MIVKSNNTINRTDSSLVSVIVAVYNTGRYLERSISSILQQSYENLEVIVVDDGSDSETSAMCDGLALQDARVKVFHRRNGGAAAARNFGIKNAEGKYIAIVDSDDRVDPFYIEELVALAEETDADVSVSGYSFETENGEITDTTQETSKVSIFSSEDAIRDHLLEDSKLYAVFWNKLFKTKLLKENSILLPEGDIYEDTRSLYIIYYYASKIAYVDKSLYFYLQRSGSVMNDKTNLRNLELLNIIPVETSEWLVERTGSLYKGELFIYSLTGYINTINYMVDRNEVVEKKWLEASSFVKKDLIKILFNHKISNKRKIACIAVIFGLNSYKLVRNTYRK